MNKQIEGMARIICKTTSNRGNCEKCGFNKQCSKFEDATNLYNNGYRKASEVAADIFAEIEASISLFSFHCDEDTNYEWGVHDALVWVDEKIAELKEKWNSRVNDGT